MPKIKNVSNENAFGVEWTDDDGTRFQLAVIKGTERMLLGILPRGSWAWNTMVVDAPQRFTLGKPVRSWAAMQRVARRWFEWRGEDQEAA